MHTLVILHTPFTHVYPSDSLREEVSFSLACLLALTKSFERLVSRGLPTKRLTSHANDFVNAKSHAREKPLLAEYRLACFLFFTSQILKTLEYKNTKEF